jgi:hypothetical protein
MSDHVINSILLTVFFVGVTSIWFLLSVVCFHKKCLSSQFLQFCGCSISVWTDGLCTGNSLLWKGQLSYISGILWTQMDGLACRSYLLLDWYSVGRNFYFYVRKFGVFTSKLVALCMELTSLVEDSPMKITSIRSWISWLCEAHQALISYSDLFVESHMHFFR